MLQTITLPPRTAPIATGWNERLAGQVYPPLGCCTLAQASDHVVCGTPQVAKVRARTYNRDIVLSRCEADDTSLASLVDMFFKRRTADRSTARDPKQVKSGRLKTPKVHATWNGVLWVDVQELFESEAGEEALREAEELEKRLQMERQQRSR